MLAFRECVSATVRSCRHKRKSAHATETTRDSLVSRAYRSGDVSGAPSKPGPSSNQGSRQTLMESINEQTDANFTARSRRLADITRGAIDRWAKESHAKDGLLEVSIRLNKIGSEILHRAIGLSGEAEEIVEVRRGLLKMASGRVQCALVKVVDFVKSAGAMVGWSWPPHTT